MTVRLAIGVGCRRGATAAEIEALVRRVLAGHDEDGTHIFTLAHKADHPGLRAAAERLGMALTGLPADALARQDDVRHRSARVVEAVGVPSVAEAAALAGAGPGSRLLVARVAGAHATCALAVAMVPQRDREDGHATEAVRAVEPQTRKVIK